MNAYHYDILILLICNFIYTILNNSDPIKISEPSKSLTFPFLLRKMISLCSSRNSAILNLVVFTSSITHFDSQWAIYYYSTCFPHNTKDVHLAPLVHEVGAMAVNVLLSLNSYKPKRWAYVTFKWWILLWSNLLLYKAVDLLGNCCKTLTNYATDVVSSVVLLLPAL